MPFLHGVNDPDFGGPKDKESLADDAPEDQGEKQADEPADNPEQEGGDEEAADGADKKSDDREAKEDDIKDKLKATVTDLYLEANSVVSEAASQIDFTKYNQLQRTEKDKYQPASTIYLKEPLETDVT